MSATTQGFSGRRRPGSAGLPPGQHLTDGFPVLSAGPTPAVDRQDWELTVTGANGLQARWDFAGLARLPAEDVTVDLHCVTGWSKLRTRWRGVPVETVLNDVQDQQSGFTTVHSYGGYTTNVPRADLSRGRAWFVFEYEDAALSPEHGGPVRLLVPHLYLWKSAKWVTGVTLLPSDEPGFWESLGYHSYGDPWLEQRYSRG